MDAIDWVQRAAFAAYQAVECCGGHHGGGQRGDRHDGWHSGGAENDTAEVAENGTEEYASKQPMPPLRNIRLLRATLPRAWWQTPTPMLTLEALSSRQSTGKPSSCACTGATRAGRRLTLPSAQTQRGSRSPAASRLSSTCRTRPHCAYPTYEIRLPVRQHGRFIRRRPRRCAGRTNHATRHYSLRGGPEAARAASNETKREQRCARGAGSAADCSRQSE